MRLRLPRFSLVNSAPKPLTRGAGGSELLGGHDTSIREPATVFSKPLLALLRFFFKHLYTTLAWSYDAVAWLVSMGQWTTWGAVALEQLPIGMVLELGHGPGHLQTKLGTGRWVPFGIDTSRQMSRLAARRLAAAGIRARLTRAGAQQLPFPAGVFEALVSTFPSEYIMESATIGEAWRVLKPGGVLVIVPTARITGKWFHDRLAAWLNRFTRQDEDPREAWLDTARAIGFQPVLEEIGLPRAVVYRLTAVKPLTA